MAHGSGTREAVATVVDQLERDIIFGALLPKQRLYEEELIARFSAKRHVVRAALETLDQRGIVERIPNRGAAVRFYSQQEVEDLYAVRTILHDAGARLIQLPPHPAWLDELRAAQDAHSAAVADQDLLRVFETNMRFHRTLFQGTRNPVLVETIDMSNAKTHGIRSHGLGKPELIRRAERDHLDMIAAVESGDLGELARLSVEHMQPARRFYEEKYIGVTP